MINLKVNEMTEMDLILCYLDAADCDNFCIAWYFGLDEYKNNHDMLLLMANAVLNHWEIPLYATDVSWHDNDECFIWYFGQNTSPEYNNYKQQEN
jgi:hypothetical protein